VVGDVAISNADKVWWPDEGITKLDVVRHYERVAPRLAPFLVDRPLTAERCPDGMRGRCFFQKNFVGPASRALRTRAIPAASAGRDVHYAIGGDMRTLLTLVNLGSLSIHLMNCRVGSLRRPDWLAFDLDPWERFADAVPVALVLRDVLAELGLRGYPKTTGGKGLHVLVPLRPGPGHHDVIAYARAVGERVVARVPDRATTEFTRARRGERVYLDAGRNTFGATIVAPYAVRRRPGAPVSTPLAWNEVNARLDPTAFNVRTIERRLAAADPWTTFRDDAQALPARPRAA
jgi:bifunctional non-homologous end joining protein LigD